MKRIYLLLSLLLCQLLCMSQVSTSQNYISARTYTSADRSGCREQVIYYDSRPQHHPRQERYRLPTGI